MMNLRVALALSLLAACSEIEPDADLAAPTSVFRGGPDGSNCAPAPPTMIDSTGALRPFQSVLAHFYRVIELRRAEVDDTAVLDADLPAPYDQSLAHTIWLAKAVEIFQDRGEIGFAYDRYYKGQFGFGPELGEADGETCRPIDDEGLRRTGLQAHTALSQAGQCGENENGTPRFWEVGPLFLFRPGDSFDARLLITKGLATWTTRARPSRCIVPHREASDGLEVIASQLDLDGLIPCDIAFRDDATTEAVVELIPSSAEVDNMPVVVRPFTAAGFAPMPNGLAAVRKVLRDGWLRATAAVEVPVFELLVPGDPTNYWVRVMGHPVGPLVSPSELLLPEERAWVDGQVGLYRDACCHEVCTTAAKLTPWWPAPVPPPPPPPSCQTECIPEGQCTTAMSSGMIVMVGGATHPSCGEDCPHPADNPPGRAPTCDGPLPELP